MLTLLELACKLLGLADWFAGVLARRQARRQAQAVANSPTSREELDETLARHDF